MIEEESQERILGIGIILLLHYFGNKPIPKYHYLSIMITFRMSSADIDFCIVFLFTFEDGHGQRESFYHLQIHRSM